MSTHSLFCSIPYFANIISETAGEHDISKEAEESALIMKAPYLLFRWPNVHLIAGAELEI